MRIIDRKKNLKERLKMKIEEKLSGIDFSRFSKVQESLLQRINNRRAMENELMNDEELDEVAAARGYVPSPKNNDLIPTKYPPKIN